MFNIDKDIIEKIKRENNLSNLEVAYYLYFFNNVSISKKDLKENNGKEMYLKFAKAVANTMNQRGESLIQIGKMLRLG